MPQNAKGTSSHNLLSAVGLCLPRLRILSLDLDSYGGPENAAALREIIAELEKACPARPEAATSDFVVAETFAVRRIQVARLLACAFVWFEVVEFVEPTELHFRACQVEVLPYIDYPLNEGGALKVLRTGPGSEPLRLDLASISSGLNAMAIECPRHFGDFLNGKADSITGDAFLQCCLYGEMVH